MPLAMSRPWKHPKTGIYWLRKRVPDGLLALVGKREELRTLGTRDPAEAKVRHAAALAEIEARWATLRAGPKHLSEREALDLAAPVGEWLISQYRDNPSEQKLWQTDYGDAVFLHRPAVSSGDYSDPKASFAIRDGDLAIMQMEQWCRSAAVNISGARGLQLDETALQLVSRSIARITQAAALKLKRLTQGEREDVVLQFSGYALSLGPSKKSSREAVSFTKLIGGWSAERRPAEKTIYDWTRLFKELALFLGHDNAGERIIPIHPALQAGGVLDFARKTKTGPIFPDLSPDKFGKRGGNGTKVIGRFVRLLGITDSQIILATADGSSR